MKKFIRTSLLFTSFFIAIFISIIIFNYFFIKSERIIVPENKNILVLGDSNSECAINDSIFKQSFNISSSADSYFYSYLKLKKIIDSNQNIDTVILSFAPHNIFDNGWLFGKSHMYSRLRIYYPLMSWEDLTFLFKGNSTAFFNAITAIAKQSMLNIIKAIIDKPNKYYGGFRSLQRNILSEVQQKLKNGEPLPFFRIPESFIISGHEILYLNKMVKICNINRIKLYLINTPKRRELLGFQRYGVKEFNKYYDKYFNKTEYLDFSRLKMPDSSYDDFVHLSKKGSTYFSIFLEKLVIKKILRNYARPYSTDSKEIK